MSIYTEQAERNNQVCQARIDLQRPIRIERVRGFQPPWRNVYVYKCPDCGNERRVRQNGSGMAPGAILCGWQK